MAKISAPNKEYTGISATVAFAKGVGETNDEHLIEWFREHGYTVEEPEVDDEAVKKAAEEKAAADAKAAEEAAAKAAAEAEAAKKADKK